jgi:cyanate lyase
LAAKNAKGLTFVDLGKVIGRDEVWVAALCYRQAMALPEEAQKLVTALGLGPEVAQVLTEFPTKGLGPVVPTDPLKAVIQEKFGDGIMSAIDFTLQVEKEADPKGDRVKLTMSGKFLPYNKW